MDWKEFGGKVLEFAPTMAGVFLGPPGAAVATAVKILAGQFGIKSPDPKPEELYQAMQMDPEHAVKLRELDLNFRLEWQRLTIQGGLQEQALETQQILAVNKTMQDEAKSEHWPTWFWRPYWGLISGTAFLIVCIFVCVLAYRAITGKDPNAIGMIPIVIGAFTALFAIPGGILGITAWGRNKLKLQDQPPEIQNRAS